MKPVQEAIKGTNLTSQGRTKPLYEGEVKPRAIETYSIPQGTGEGMKINRVFTKEGIDPLNEVEYELKTSQIKETDGTVDRKSVV